MLSPGLSMTNLLLFSEPPPLAATVTSTKCRHDLGEDDRRRVVAGVLARELRIGRTLARKGVVSRSL